MPCMEGDGLSGSLLPGRHHRLILAVLLVLLMCLVPDTAAAEVIPTNDLPPSTPPKGRGPLWIPIARGD